MRLIYISFDIPSKKKVVGLCRGLKLINRFNPRHVILLDSEQGLHNQGVDNVVLIECMTSVWSIVAGVPLDMFCFSQF